MALPASCKMLALNAEPFAVSGILARVGSLFGEHGGGLNFDVEYVSPPPPLQPPPALPLPLQPPPVSLSSLPSAVAI